MTIFVFGADRQESCPADKAKLRRFPLFLFLAQYNLSNMEEIWKDIEGYEGLYQVSNLGRVKSLERWRKGNTKPVLIKEKIKIPRDNGRGYFITFLYKNNKQRNEYIHRLVAMAFIPNPDNLPQVNHKDENKANNCVDNLEWCTCKYNNGYGTKRERLTLTNRNNKKTSTPILQFDLDGNFIKEWPSMREVSRSGVARCENVYRACAGIYKQANGFIWRYK